jgi:hypothetical protein
VQLLPSHVDPIPIMSMFDRAVRGLVLRALLPVPLILAAAASFAQDSLGLSSGGIDAGVSGSLSQWSIVPLTGARLEGGARLDPRQELRFSTTTGLRSYSGITDFWPSAARFDSNVGLDQPRATYRYTWLSRPDLDLKVGLTSNLTPLGSSLHSGLSASTRFAALPLMHLSGIGRLSENWRVSVDADGLWTARGRSLDFGLNVGYNLNRSFQLFGGYRLSDFAGDAEDYYGSTTTNSANVGLRYNF